MGLLFLMEVDAHSFLKILKVSSYISSTSSSTGADQRREGLDKQAVALNTRCWCLWFLGWKESLSMTLPQSQVAALVTPHVSNQDKFFLCLLMLHLIIFAGTIFGRAVLVFGISSGSESHKILTCSQAVLTNQSLLCEIKEFMEFHEEDQLVGRSQLEQNQFNQFRYPA